MGAETLASGTCDTPPERVLVGNDGGRDVREFGLVRGPRATGASVWLALVLKTPRPDSQIPPHQEPGGGVRRALQFHRPLLTRRQ